MKYIALFLSICLTIIRAEPMSDKELILQAYKDFYSYKIDKNTDALNEILDFDFTLTHMTGYVQSKDEWFSQIKDERMKYFGYEIDGVEISTNGENGLLVGRSKTDARIYGMRHVWNLELTMPMKKRDGEWIIQKAVAKSY